jgi:hypothetical protein
MRAAPAARSLLTLLAASSAKQGAPMTVYVNLVNATFQPPTPGANPASCRLGRASPDGAGDVGEDQ